MRVHTLQHVPFEGLGSMEAVLLRCGHAIGYSHLYQGDALPAVNDVDMLIIMGGPMGVHDTDRYPWLAAEKDFIHAVINAGKKVLGICLGAQLIADVLGAAVTRNAHREIGWFPLQRDKAAIRTRLGGLFPESLVAFHWHGDTFDIPVGAVPLASSEACQNQGFIYKDRVLALQCHLETTPESACALIEHCGEELDGSRFVQDADSMLADPARFSAINRAMEQVLLQWPD